ncbi:hypothetical protein M3Y98_00220800 [Aphelenchoides besseyi]|nr:hypothetical protein M3Y98_00220800 [Aphelenchoides besseyi]
MFGPNELSRILLQLAASSNFNIPSGIPAVGAARTNKTAPFHGRHSIWRHFEVQRDKSVYRCQVPGCTATYTWPPSTTVAGRHLRDKHSNVYAQVLNDEADRRNRKRVIEVASIQQRTDGNRRNESGTARSSFDATLSPPSTTAGEPSTPPFIMEPSLKRARYDEEFFARLRSLHHDDASFLPPSSVPISPLDSAISKKVSNQFFAETEGEMREKIKRLEESMAELQSEKKRIGNRLEEVEALYNAECRTSQSLTVSLEREAEARVQLEAEIRSLKQNLQRREQEWPNRYAKFFYYQRRQIPYHTFSEGKRIRNSASVMELVDTTSTEESETEGEMREKIKRLEESMAELQSEKKRIGNRLEETKALSNAECRTSQSMTVRLERDSEVRV